MTDRAAPRVGLVLGAGGLVGQAYHAGVLAALVSLALYGAHRTLTVASRRQCAADGGRWDPGAGACVGARPPLAPAGP